MKIRNIIIVIFLIAICTFLIWNKIEYDKFSGINPLVKKLVISSLEFQYYKNSRKEPEKIFSREFYNSEVNIGVINNEVYKYAPYHIKKISQEIKEIGNKVFIYLTLEDDEGIYYQEVILSRQNDSYLIDAISNDI